MMRRLLYGLLACLLMVGLVGCGLGQSLADKAAEKAVEGLTGVSTSKDGETVNITTKDGDKISLSGSEGKLPDGFPLPLIKGAKVETGSKITTNGKVGYTAMINYTGTHKETGDFYEKALKDLGIEVERTDIDSNGDIMIMLLGSSDKYDAWVSLSGTGNKGGQISIMWGDK